MRSSRFLTLPRTCNKRRNIASRGKLDPPSIRPARVRIIGAEGPSQTTHLGAYARVDSGVERGRLAEDIYTDCILRELVSFPSNRALNQVTKQLSAARRGGKLGMF